MHGRVARAPEIKGVIAQLSQRSNKRASRRGTPCRMTSNGAAQLRLCPRVSARARADTRCRTQNGDGLSLTDICNPTPESSLTHRKEADSLVLRSS